MENANEVVNPSITGERDHVDDRVFAEQEEEKVRSGSQITGDGEDEVFEEAVGTEDVFLDGAIESHGHGDENGSDKTTGEADSGDVQESNATEEEPFVEAVGPPVDAENQEQVTTPAREDSKPSELLPDKIDEGGTKNWGKELKDAGFNGQTEVSQESGVKEYMRSDLAIEDTGGPEDYGQTNSVGKLAGDDGEKSEKGIAVSEGKIELTFEPLPENGKIKQPDNTAVNAGDPYNNAGSIASLKDEPVLSHDTNDQKESLPDFPAESQNEDIEESLGETVDLEIKVVPDEGEKVMNGSPGLVSNLQDKVEDVKDVYVVQDSKYHQTLKGSSEIHTFAEPKETPKPRSFLASEESKSKMTEVIRVSKYDLMNNNHHENTNVETLADEECVVAQEPEQKEQKVQKVTANGEFVEDGKFKLKELKDQKGTESKGFFENQEVKHPAGPSSAVSEESTRKAFKDDGNCSNQENNRSQTKPSPVVAASVKSTNSATSSARPAGLGRAAPLLEPAHRVVQQPRANGAASHAPSQQIDDPSNSGEFDEGDETREKLQMIRVKFLRLAHRLGQTPHNVVVAQVLYRLGLAEQLRGRNGGRVGAFSFDRASAMAEQLEAAGNEPLDFSCTIMVLGKSGVGKSATINSLFDEVKFGTDAFQTGTKKVQDVVGTVHGIKVRVIDTPGLLPSWSDQQKNGKILNSVKQFIKKTPPDIVLYLDRLDVQSRDFGDMPLLRTITEVFGPAIWFNAIVVLTHAASAPPDGPNGTASSYDMFVTQRSHAVQNAIRQAAGDMRLMNPVSLVENHSACRTNRAGQRVLPNGQVWKPHLLLLSFASKILAEANTLLKLQDTPPGKPFAPRSRTPPLPFLLSSLLQSRPQVKLPEEQFDNEDGIEDDLDDSSDEENASEYDELPPFRSLTKEQIGRLTKAQKKSYFDELEYREKLFMRKQLKEERRRRRMMKRMAAEAEGLPNEYTETAEEESGSAASVPVPMPDMALPASFDSDNPTHRYRCLDTSNQWLVRAVLDNPGWDHDVGYEGINVERLFVVKEKVPVSFSGQITKDKKDATVQMELASSLKHGEGKSTSLGFDMQTIGKDLAYTLRSETRFTNYRRNKATAGVSCTLMGDALSAGVKVEDKLIANRRFQVVMAGGLMSGRGDIAYGGSLEAQLKDKDFPMGRSLSTLGISVMDWHGDLAIGCNLQSQLPIGRHTNIIARGNLNNRGAGQVSLRINSSEQLQVALIGLVPLLKKVLSGYTQQAQF